jgi:hypothetical protein
MRNRFAKQDAGRAIFGWSHPGCRLIMSCNMTEPVLPATHQLPSPDRNLHSSPGLIEVKLRELHQLFNSMDPSPFNEKDLDHDAEEFIVSWALEHSAQARLKLVVHLTQLPDTNAHLTVENAVHHYFSYRADLNWREFKQLMLEGRHSLIIGLAFMAVCVSLAELLEQMGGSPWLRIFRESLTVGGWVAMWRPLEIYLYRWWPLRRRGQVYRKLSKMEVEVRQSPSPDFSI